MAVGVRTQDLRKVYSSAPPLGAAGGFIARADAKSEKQPKAQIPALDGLSLEILPGEIFGLLGPNGAGKSTTVGVLTTRVRPTSGQAWILLWEIIREYHEAGKTILLTTHNMEEADALCQRLAIVDHGRVIAGGTPVQLKASIPGGFVLRLRFGNLTAGLLQRLQVLPGVREVRAADSTGADVYADRGGSLIPEIANLASNSGAELSEVHISEPSLENLFLHHTGRSLRD